MKRGEIWSLRDKQYASKARPVVIVQSDEHQSFDSLILCLLTTFDSTDIKTRVLIKPSKGNGLLQNSYVMTDKIVTVDKAQLGERIGFLSAKDMKSVSEQMKTILGL